MSLGAHALHGRRALGSRGVRSRSAGVAVTCPCRSHVRRALRGAAVCASSLRGLGVR